MKPRVKAALFLLLVAAATAPRLFARERSAFLQDIEFRGRTYSLDAVFRPGQADLRLRGKAEKNLSAGMPGENLLLGVRSGSSSFYVFWLNYRHKAIRLAYYDSRSDSSRLLPLRDFTAIGLPQINEAGGRLRALIFLANRSDNDDIFHYELAARTLTRITQTPFSEKVFSVDEKDGRLEIGTRSLWAEFRYRFDPRRRQSVLLTENRLRSRLKSEPMAGSAALDRDYYNTYIGFGDSITEGQIEGVVRPELCFLTQMRDIYLPLVYGAAIPVNLGVGGTSTSGGAERVNNDLDENPGFYFLLFYGVNDVYRADFSLASSLENIEFMIDAALARGMRVIVTTLTPRKDYIALYQYYWDHLYAFSAAILDLAGEKGVAAIDTLDAFMKTDPPNGWKTLLEAIITGISKGNHPNEAGHSVIAGLFANALAQFPPLAPTGVTVVDPLNTLSRTASWNINHESDFSHFRVEFGFQPQALPYALDTPASYCTFNLFPFLPRVYFRVQTVDKGGRRSSFSTINGASPAASPAQKSKK
jgi:lysophospholipase L1-like esterase